MWLLVASPTTSAQITDRNTEKPPATAITAASNAECADAFPIVGEGTFRFDNSGPITFDGLVARDCDTDTRNGINGFVNDVWFCWTATFSGNGTVDTCGQTIVDTLLEVDEGCSCPTTSDTFVACNDERQVNLIDAFHLGTCSYQSQISFSAKPGQNYLIRLGTSSVVDLTGGTGTFTITKGDGTSVCTADNDSCQPPDGWNALASDGVSHSAIDDFVPAMDGELTQICWWGTYFNGDEPCRIGGSDEFEVRYFAGAGGIPGPLIGGPFRMSDGSLTVVGPARTNRTLVENLPEFQYSAEHAPVVLTGGDCYWVEIVNRADSSCRWLWSESRRGNGRSYQDGASGVPLDGYDIRDLRDHDLAMCIDLPLDHATDCTSAPTNDDCDDAAPISDGETFFDTIGATTDGLPEPLCDIDGVQGGCCGLPLADHQIHRDIWFDYVATCTGTMTAEIHGSNFDNRVAIYEGIACPTTPEMFACSDDAGGEGLALSAIASAPVSLGEAYKIRVGGYGSRNGDCFIDREEPGCSDPTCDQRVCDLRPACCTNSWTNACVQQAVTSCAGDEGIGNVRVFCTEPPAADKCEATVVASLPATFEGLNANATHDCDLVAGRHSWIAFELCERSSVVLDYGRTAPPFASAWPAITRDCPCADAIDTSSVSRNVDGNPLLRWDCLAPGTYYYPVLAGVGSEGAYHIEVTDGACMTPCANGRGDCCQGNGSPQCNEPECCAAVCAVDSFCCDGNWDDLCAEEAARICPACPGSGCEFAIGSCTEAHASPGCADREVCEVVCVCDPSCCTLEWDELCAGFGARNNCGAGDDCNMNGVPDILDVSRNPSLDCNTNNILDECEPDCNANGTVDECDIAGCVSIDCNRNGVPDECDVDPALGADCNQNNIPDDCEPAELQYQSPINLTQFGERIGCLSQLCRFSQCPVPLFEGPCCHTLDVDFDGDIDLRDLADVLNRFTSQP